ncbi:MAG: 16S rRNA (cytosine(1402)-N(4))-methyltransferase RsmH [Kineosporiaceae bacterium]
MTQSSRPAQDRHVPVMLRECVDVLAPALSRPGSVHVDGTLGMGGHAEAILERCPGSVLVGIDRDEQALALAGERLARFGSRVHLVHAVYDEVDRVLAAVGARQVDSVLLDLGVSSLQLDEAERGFAYAVDAPLDMRMDRSTGTTAAEVLNTYSAADLARILHRYGEERFARRIAGEIVRRREVTPWTTSGPLVQLLRDVVPMASQRSGGHPAKRTFQALRIEVNGELAALEAAVPGWLDAVAFGGRVAVLTYHSLEDRLVKQEFVARSKSTAPAGLPVELPEHAPTFASLTRGGAAPGAQEVEANPRAASARLRAVERVRPDHRTAPRTRRGAPS